MISHNLIEKLTEKQGKLRLEKAVIEREIEERELTLTEIETIDQIFGVVQNEIAGLKTLDKMLKEYQKNKREQSRNYLSELMKIWMGEIFPEEGYSFHIHTYTKGKYTYTKLLNSTYDSEGKKRVPKLSSGFGARQSMSFFACAIIAMLAEVAPFFMLDEMFSLLSPSKKEVMSSILAVLEEMGFQFIMIEQESHVFTKVNHKQITLAKDNGVSKIVDVTYIRNKIDNTEEEEYYE